MKPRSSLYVPVLRTHAAERDAVRELTSDVRGVTAPLFEVSERFALKTDELRASSVARRLLQATYGSAGPGELYIDLAAIVRRPDAAAIAIELERLLLSLHSDAQLVLRLADLNPNTPVRAAGQLIDRNGCALRVTTADCTGIALSNIATLLKKAGVEPVNIDLVIDCQVVAEGQTLKGTAAKLEGIAPWRSVTYVGGSFPPNLAQMKKNDQYQLARHEWIAFVSERFDTRRTRFGDYTVQHPLQPDPFLKTLPSGSIRYTSDTYWVVMRGEKLDSPTGPGHEQYIAQAQLLCGRPEYLGRAYSAGDEYIYVTATEMKHPGNPQKWLQAAMNHHITLAARQIAHALAA